MARNKIIGLVLILFIIIPIMLILLTMLNEPEEVKSGNPEIGGLERYNENINTAGGEVEIYWEIINYSKDNDILTFRIENEENKVKEEIIISPSKLNQIHFDNGTGEYHNTINLERGEYNFEWLNGNDLETLKLNYKITHNRKVYTSSECPYLMVFILVLLSFSLLGSVFMNNHGI